MSSTVRIPAHDGPQRAPDGETEDGQFYFWLGDDGIEDDESYGILDDEADQ